MKIFLTASIHGKKQYEANYRKIVELVVKSGHKIQSDHILGDDSQRIASWSGQQDVDFHRWVMEEIKKSDVIIAELSYASTSVGYLVALAVQQNKPVVIFYAGQEEPHLFHTLEEINDKLMIVRYHDVDELEKEVPRMLEYVSELQDVRFNFFISPSLSYYLSWISKDRREPRSVYLRRLIEQDMAQNKEYLQSL